MHQTGKQLLSLMFRPGEEICVSPNKWGYHSVDLDQAQSDKVTLYSPTEGKEVQYCDSDDLTLVALNPIKGFRRDENCTAYRNFLIELDFGSMEDQRFYIERQIKLPFSAAIFSGNKSLHYLISLDQDLPSEKIYRYIAEWILNIATAADQNIKNPSRSIRIPGAFREPGKQQQLKEFKGIVALKELKDFLKAYPQAKPRPKRQIEPSSRADVKLLKPWATFMYLNGLDPKKPRNSQWFALACEFALAGFSESDTITILSPKFSEDSDFKEKEWLNTIHSGFKHIYEHRK